MKSTRPNWLVIGIAALALLNIALLAVIWLNRSPDDAAPAANSTAPRGDARNMLIKELALDSNQVARFDSLRTTHFAEIGKLRDEMRSAKDALFEGLQKESNAPLEAARRIGDLQARLDLATYSHFAQLRALCNEDQKKTFDKIIGNVLRGMGSRPPSPGFGGQGAPPPGSDRPDDGPPGGPHDGPPGDRRDGPPPQQP